MSALVLSTFITTHYKPKRFSMLSLECVEGGQSWSEHYNDCILYTGKIHSVSWFMKVIVYT